MNTIDFNRYMRYLLLAILAAVVLINFDQFKDLHKFYKTDQNTIYEINKIQIDKVALDSSILPEKLKFDLINQSVIESDEKINNLKAEINQIKQKILEEYNKGLDVSSQISKLKSKEEELKIYLAEKRKQISALKDTVLTYPQKLLKYDNEIYAKGKTYDSLKLIHANLSIKCNL